MAESNENLGVGFVTWQINKNSCIVKKYLGIFFGENQVQNRRTELEV